MKYSNFTWILLAVMAVLMVAAVGSNMGLFSISSATLSAESYRAGDIVVIDYSLVNPSPNIGANYITATFNGVTKTNSHGARGTNAGTFAFDTPANDGEYDVVLRAYAYADSYYGKPIKPYQHGTETLTVFVTPPMPNDYCVGTSLYTDFVLIGAVWKPTPVLNSLVCGYTHDVPVIPPTDDEPPVNDTPSSEPPVDYMIDTTVLLFVILFVLLIGGVAVMAYIKKR